MFKIGQRVTLIPKTWSEFKGSLSEIFPYALVVDELSSTHREIMQVEGALYGEDEHWFYDLLADGGAIIRRYDTGWYMVNINGVKLKFHEKVLCLKEDIRSVDEEVFTSCLLL